MSTKWDYMTIGCAPSPDGINNGLATASKDGWELVTTTVVPVLQEGAPVPVFILMIFKRPQALVQKASPSMLQV